MEPFRFTRQAIAFVALIGAVAVIVAIAAPFGSIALGAVALVAIGVVLIKALLRARDWWPLTAVEGTVALSGLVLVAGGLAVMAYALVSLGAGHPLRMMVGWPYVDPSRTDQRTRAVSYSDPSRQQRLKDALREAGIPFTVRMEDGKEFVGWKAEHDAAAEAINQKVSEGPRPGQRSAHIPDAALHNEFTAWLTAKGSSTKSCRCRARTGSCGTRAPAISCGSSWKAAATPAAKARSQPASPAPRPADGYCATTRLVRRCGSASSAALGPA